MDDLERAVSVDLTGLLSYTAKVEGAKGIIFSYTKDNPTVSRKIEGIAV